MSLCRKVKRHYCETNIRLFFAASEGVLSMSLSLSLSLCSTAWLWFLSLLQNQSHCSKIKKAFCLLPFYNSPPYPKWILRRWCHPFHHCPNAFFNSSRPKENKLSLLPLLSLNVYPVFHTSFLVAHSRERGVAGGNLISSEPVPSSCPFIYTSTPVFPVVEVAHPFLLVRNLLFADTGTCQELDLHTNCSHLPLKWAATIDCKTCSFFP